MITISATQFQNHLFEYLDKVEPRETIIIERYQQEVARLISTKPTDWREKMRLQPQLYSVGGGTYYAYRGYLGELCLTNQYYLLDIHALTLWNLKQGISQEFIQFLDYQDRLGGLLISAISFWEIALLTQKGKLALTDIHA